jgi:hypothetical protein
MVPERESYPIGQGIDTMDGESVGQTDLGMYEYEWQTHDCRSCKLERVSSYFELIPEAEKIICRNA